MILNQNTHNFENGVIAGNEITLVIPNRSNEKYLDACIRSVVSQNDKNFTFIVSDNHSTDGSIQIINSYQQYINKIISPPSPIGYKEHLLWILEQVQTEYVIFLAGDDIAHNELIYCYRKSLEKNGKSKPAFVCSPFYYIDELSNIYNRIKWPKRFCGNSSDMVHTFLKGPICNISSVAWNVSKLKSLDIPEEIGNSIDWYLYILLSKNNHVLLVNKRLLFYRVHRESTGNSNVVGHTENCMRLFLYLKENVFKNDTANLKQIDANIIAFNQVIAGKRGNPFKLLPQRVINIVTALIFKLQKSSSIEKIRR